MAGTNLWTPTILYRDLPRPEVKESYPRFNLYNIVNNTFSLFSRGYVSYGLEN